MLKKITLWLIFLSLPYLSFSTHIVGGVLNYTYNGGNIYTITLKLYRDCGSSSASFPNSATIKIKGNNGANFSPSKDLTISLGTITTLSANLMPCAVAPNPVPCVQQGIYTQTISLPANTGGYHLYYQVSARNLSLTNINGACNCIGESFYAYIPDNTVSSNSNSNAVFSLFPPLFICANQPFSFNHSATDANGDSLVYSLYTPYDDNTAPTYTNNVAFFPQVVYQSGYTTNNPLGATPFNLNSATGILTGTPTTIGQFVVGVRVKEYRNGVYISQTLRDFQFNVLNCPAPPPTLAVSNMTINNGCSVKVTATGITSTSATWQSIYPGTPGAYNGYLSCTSGCLSPTIAATTGTPPPYADFVVCGIATNCLANNVCDTFRVYFNPPLSVSITPGNPALCNGQTSTTLSALGSGGTPPYTYLWNNINPTQTISVGAGTYNIKLTDASGCPPAYSSAVVISYSVPVSVNAGADKTVCITSPVTSLNATVTGASGGLWSGGTGTFSPNNTTTSNLFYTPGASELSAGFVTLSLTTTGSGACPSATDLITIYYSGFTGTVSSFTNPISCYGGSNGTASVNVAGGKGPHTYLWTTVPTQSTATASNLSLGIYSVTVKDAIGCERQETVAITQPLPIALNSTLSNVSCFAGTNGSLSVAVVGGSAPYTYSWTPGNQTTATLTNLTAGTYSVKVTDSKNCILTSTLPVTQPSSLAVAFTQTQVSCFNGSNGSISALVSGGSVPYTYSWNPGGASSPAISNLTAAIYSLTITDNLNCVLAKTVSITQPSSLTVTSTVTNESCSYLNNGSAGALVSGGTAGYTYLWLPGSFTTSAISNLTSGNYSLQVTDVKGCSQTTVLTVTEPGPLLINFINPTAVKCFGGTTGSVTANVSGGTPSYTYSWSPLASSSATYTNLGSGSYTLVVSDTKSCTTTASLTISQPSSLTLSNTQTNITCFGGSDGSATSTVTGGTSPYSFFWLPSGQTASVITGLSAGTYTTLVTDVKGCTISATQTLTQTNSITIAFTQTPVTCFNGSDGALSSLLSGGNGNFSYSWSPGTSTASALSGLTAGTYTLYATDVFNCSAEKTVSITQPSLLVISTSFTNETCNYLNDGKASVTLSGGTPGYSFLWQPGAVTTATLSNLASGNYSVTATDSNGCTVNTLVTIGEPAPLSATISNVTQVSCPGGTNGSASAGASGGTANYSYTWLPSGSSGAVLANLSQGIYTVLVSDSKSCAAQATVTITQPSSITLAITAGPVACFGGNNGSLSLSPAGGTSPYTYFWLPGGQTTPSSTNLTAGTYTVNVLDANNCAASSTYALSQSASITIVFTTTQVSCFGGTNGKITSSITGGNAPYTFNWSYGAISTPSIGGLPAGIYTLTVTDNLGCSASKTVSISQPSLLVITATVTNETCDYLNNGTSVAQASGGTASYSYLWQPGSFTTASISNLASGTYTVYASDILGCTSSTTAIISQPAPVAISFTNLVNVSCNGGNDGSATAVGSGGTPNYSYTWSPVAVTANLANNLSTGIYSVTASDSHGCVTGNTVSIAEPAPLNLIPSISNVICNGGSNGAISIAMSGGTSPYTHVLMPGNIVGANFTNLQPGTYSILTSDAQNCSNNTTISINQPINISTATSFTDADCAQQNGVASISVTSGGTPPFTYNWLPAGGTSSVTGALFAGSYSVQVTDSIGCVSTKIVNINNVNGPVVSISSYTNVTCNGGSNGALSAAFTGGTGATTYSWSPSGGTALTATNLSSGLYVIQITDNAGCIGLATSSLLAEPPPIVLSVFPSNVNCFGGSNGGASANISGGTPGYTYNWLPSASGVTTISGLSANVYTLSVTDAQSCIESVTFAVTQPAAPLSVSAVAYSVSCFGASDGSVSSTASGGTAPYNYVLQPVNSAGQTISNLSAGSYTVLTSDFKSCTASTVISVIEPLPISLSTGAVNANCSLANGQVSVTAAGGTGAFVYTWLPAGGTSSLASNLFAGNYTVIATDGNNCVSSASQTLLNNPEPLVSISSVTNVSCFNGANGAAAAVVTGGTGPFTYSWMPNGGTADTGTGLTAGNYSVLVSSANGCTVMTESPLITQPFQLFIAVTTTEVSCFNGTNGVASAFVSGGTGAFAYTWQTGVSTTSTAAGFSAGTYSIEVTDLNACVKTATFAIAQPSAALSISLASLPVSCFGGTNGSATVASSGGTFPYSFNWLPGNINGSSISNLIANSYTLSATDAKGCSVSDAITVSQFPAIQLSIAALNSNCSLANGQLSVTASGGANAFTYTWSPSGGTNAQATNLISGNYTVTVTDANSCVSTATETVIDNPAPLVSIATLSHVSCFAGADGIASASVSGGSGPFLYTWLPAGGSSATASGLPAGIYSIQVIASNGCTVISSSSVITQPLPIATNVTTFSVSCFGGNNGSASFISAGGTPGYTYILPAGASFTSPLSALSAGNYTILAQDANSCVQSATFAIAEPASALNVALVSSGQVGCFGASSGSVTIAANGGTPVYFYNWLPSGGNAASATSLSAATYTAIITDNNGCTTDATVSITQPSQALSVIDSTSAVSCFGGTNGSATVTPAGGTPGYSYLWSPSGGSSQTATGLSFGTYTVVVTDQNFCQTSLPVIIQQPSEITGSLVAINSSCDLPNGSILPQISGGTGPYTYLWQPGALTPNGLNNLAPGTYTLQTTDAQSCIKNFTASLINIPGPGLTIPFTKNASCFGGNTGSATLNISQGTAPFSISWAPFGGSTTTATSLLAGTYTANVTDALGCVATKTTLINEPSMLVASVISLKKVSCFAGTNGSVSVIATGGTPGYTYLWNTNFPGNNITNLAAGSYTVKLKDANNCTVSISANIPQPEPTTSTVTGIENAHCYSGTGNATVSAAGGEIPYSYSWNSNPVQTGNILSSVVSGNYTVKIKDLNNCVTQKTISITQPSQVMTSVTKTDTICYGQTGVLTAIGSGGAGNYHYTWLPGAVTNSGSLSFTASANVIYTVLAFDENGCAGKDASSTITVYNLTAANITIDGLDLVCPGRSSILEATTYGNTGPLKFSWNNSLQPKAGPHIVTPQKATTYIVNVSNSCGLSLADSITVQINDLPLVDLLSDTLRTCSPGNIHFTDKSKPVNSADPLMSWMWDFGDGTFSGEQNPTHAYTEAGTYTVNLEVTTDRGCTNTNTSTPVIIHAYPKPFAAFVLNSDSLDLPYDILKATNQSTGAVNYNWTFGQDGNSSLHSPQFELQSLGDIKIQLIAISNYGCLDTAYRYVNTNADIVFPNAFTPNTNGSSLGAYSASSLSNDVFFPYTSGVTDYNLQIFNRWGELIFESTDLAYGWDGYYKGKLCQVGVYVWKANVHLSNGKKFRKSGNLTLLR
ncbi:hypothetical protein CNR22_18835 [Sphingobacteriaceae bacterium]|nr:hypothetical protein CNR22_18835 [Sphingobacteriaceae bacterium]